MDDDPSLVLADRVDRDFFWIFGHTFGTTKAGKKGERSRSPKRHKEGSGRTQSIQRTASNSLEEALKKRQKAVKKKFSKHQDNTRGQGPATHHQQHATGIAHGKGHRSLRHQRTTQEQKENSGIMTDKVSKQKEMTGDDAIAPPKSPRKRLSSNSQATLNEHPTQDQKTQTTNHNKRFNNCRLERHGLPC